MDTNSTINSTPVVPPSQPTTETTPDKSRTDKGQVDPKYMKARLERAAKAERARVLRELGIDDLEKGKLALTEAHSFRQSQLSEGEKTTAALQAAEQRALDAEKRALELETQQKRSGLENAIRSYAGELGAEYPDDVIAKVRENGATFDALMSEDGKVKLEKVKLAVDALKKERPTWFKIGGPGSPSNRNGRGSDAGGAAKEKAKADLERQIKRSF